MTEPRPTSPTWSAPAHAEPRPTSLGVTGAVAAGKSTFAGELARRLAATPRTLTVEVVGADGFLIDNAALEARG